MISGLILISCVTHRFSGVTAEDLESAAITLRDVQAVLLSMFSAESILIGHSLESDLLALKVSRFFTAENVAVSFFLFPLQPSTQLCRFPESLVNIITRTGFYIVCASAWRVRGSAGGGRPPSA